MQKKEWGVGEVSMGWNVAEAARDVGCEGQCCMKLRKGCQGEVKEPVSVSRERKGRASGGAGGSQQAG